MKHIFLSILILSSVSAIAQGKEWILDEIITVREDNWIQPGLGEFKSGNNVVTIICQGPVREYGMVFVKSQNGYDLERHREVKVESQEVCTNDILRIARALDDGRVVAFKVEQSKFVINELR